jgi:hypothetical protein
LRIVENPQTKKACSATDETMPEDAFVLDGATAVGHT